MKTHFLQDRDLHHALIEVSWLVFHHLDSYNLVRPHVLALDHLAERSLTKHI